MDGKYTTRPNCETLGYSVLSLGASKKPEAGADSLKFETGMRLDGDAGGYAVMLRCTREEGDFFFDCLVEGSFKYHEPVGAANARNAWTNGCMILYGILRGLYAQTAAQCVHKTLILPSVMMADVVNQRIDEIQKQVAATERGK